MRSTLSATLRAVLYLSAPAAAGLILLRVSLVQTIFERGAFTETSTQMVAWALALFALGLPAHSLVEIIVRAFYAMHDTKTPVAIGVAAMVLNIILSLALIALFEAAGWMAHGGLALSNSLATMVEMVILWAVIQRRLDGLEGRRVARSLVRIALSSVAMGAGVALTSYLLRGTSAWIVAGSSIAVGLAVYGGMSLALGAPEPAAVWGLVRSRRRAPQP
jgi:putative peptidoglycan lipid II flippase